jgi:NADPH-dependent 2,4-dienoyl-CoA reductase/sulfur reductase-like enzyme
MQTSMLWWRLAARPKSRHRAGRFGAGGLAQKDIMARTDAIVLGAGIVGTSIALQLARRGLGVALVDRRAPGEETSYGNAGIIEGKSVCPIV